jgi:hypothetical protein
MEEIKTQGDTKRGIRFGVPERVLFQEISERVKGGRDRERGSQEGWLETERALAMEVHKMAEERRRG